LGNLADKATLLFLSAFPAKLEWREPYIQKGLRIYSLGLKLIGEKQLRSIKRLSGTSNCPIGHLVVTDRSARIAQSVCSSCLICGMVWGYFLVGIPKLCYFCCVK
jgi:hypothetical protein